MEIVLALLVGAVVGKWLTVTRYREERAREARVQREAAVENQRRVMANPYMGGLLSATYCKPEPVRLLTWEPHP